MWRALFLSPSDLIASTIKKPTNRPKNTAAHKIPTITGPIVRATVTIFASIFLFISSEHTQKSCPTRGGAARTWLAKSLGDFDQKGACLFDVDETTLLLKPASGRNAKRDLGKAVLHVTDILDC